jgi:hypothetical protein
MRQRRGALSAGLGESNEAASQVARRHSGRRSARIHTRKGVKSFVRLVVEGATARLFSTRLVNFTIVGEVEVWRVTKSRQG